tara:strand:- start:5403 stop:6134 length:732 start_codon:yes stop_codon:yes gene_type:complete
MNIHKIITSFHKYTFNTNNIQKLLVSNKIKNKSCDKKEKIQVKSNKIKQVDFFIPQEKDFLFWLWIIFLYGFSEYEILRKNTFITEKNYKISFIDKLRNKDNKHILKKLKTKLAEIEGNLANDNLLHLKNLETMLIIDNFNFIYINDKIYYENITYPGNKTCIIKYYPKDENYGLLLENDKLYDYRNKLFVVDSYIKPIKSISNYKAQDLRDICKKLNIDIMKTPSKKKTKKELYQLISEKLQ